MRIIRLFLVALLFLPVMSHAQEQQLEHTTLIMATKNLSFFSEDNLAVNCETSIPYLTRELEGGFTAELRAVSVNRKTGEFIKGRYQVGTLQSCYSVLGEEYEDNPLGTQRRNEIVHTIAVNGKTYGALGTIQRSGFYEFADEDVAPIGFLADSSILVDVVDGVVVASGVGAMTINWHQQNELNGTVTMRFFAPQDEGQATLAEILGL